MRSSFQKVQHVLRLQSCRGNEEDERRDWKLQQNAESGAFIEMVARYVVPFDKARVEKAMKSVYTRQDGELRLCEVRLFVHQSQCDHFLTMAVC